MGARSVYRFFLLPYIERLIARACACASALEECPPPSTGVPDLFRARRPFALSTTRVLFPRLFVVTGIGSPFSCFCCAKVWSFGLADD